MLIFSGECVSGALHWKELFDLAKEAGFETPRTVNLSSIEITKPELKKILGKIIYSLKYFKCQNCFFNI